MQAAPSEAGEKFIARGVEWELHGTVGKIWMKFGLEHVQKLRIATLKSAEMYYQIKFLNMVFKSDVPSEVDTV